MGNEEKARAVEAGGDPRVPRVRRGSQRKSALFEAEEILEERPSMGRAGRWFLVKWAGYHTSWEAWRAAGPVKA
jgi:hypothetical protein